MKNKINKKLRDFRAPVLCMAFQPLFSFSRALHNVILDLHGFVRARLRDVRDDIELSRQGYLLEFSDLKARLTTIERWLYVITFALIVALFLLVVLMFI